MLTLSPCINGITQNDQIISLKTTICTIPEPELETRSFKSNPTRNRPEVKKPYSSWPVSPIFVVKTTLETGSALQHMHMEHVTWPNQTHAFQTRYLQQTKLFKFKSNGRSFVNHRNLSQMSARFGSVIGEIDMLQL